MSHTANVDAEGRAYGRPPASPDDELIKCGPGTLGGELLRRYWQPVALSRDVADLPVPIKILDEDLVLYRDKSGTPGLLYPRCMHRGTSLLFGKVEERGIRCCYHGWLFDADGKCLEMPCEPDNPVQNHIRQPWYPLVEKFGILFAYMGPPERQPLFPEFSIADDLGDDEEIVSYTKDTGPNGGGRYGVHPKLAARSDYNWWQMFDNFMDAFHVVILHCRINGLQFEEGLSHMPNVKFEPTADGVRSVQHRTMNDGRIHQRLSQVLLPNMNGTAGVTDDDLGRSGLGWTVAIDDQHHRSFGISRVKKVEEPSGNYMDKVGMLRDDWGPEGGQKPMKDWSLEDHQRWQNDYTAQKGQGSITLHSEEHLTRIDKGTGLMRQLFKKQAEAVARGEDPIGVAFDTPYRVVVQAGNAILNPKTLERVEGFDGRRAN